MAITITKGDAQEASGPPTVGPAAQRSTYRVNGGRLIVVFLVALLVGSQVVIFELSRSKGAVSWQAGWAKGVHLGLKAHRSNADQAPSSPPDKACLPTQSQQARGIKTRRVEVAAHEVDTGDFEIGCIAGYHATVSSLKG
jgi:hypothetical protein